MCCVFADRIVFNEKDIGVSTMLGVNGRLFITPYEHLDALVCVKSVISTNIYFINLFIVIA